MVSAPVNLYTARTANQSPLVRVFLGPADGTDDEWTRSFDLIPLEIVRLAGSRPDHAVFEFRHSVILETVDLNKTATNLAAEVSFNRQVYIDVVDLNGFHRISRVLFWGELLAETLRIDRAMQRVTITASVVDYHYGDMLEGEYRFDPDEDFNFVVVPVDPVFNPLIDGIIEPNKADYPRAPDQPDPPHSFWVDPESVRTDDAKAVNGAADIELWTLGDAITTLGFWLDANLQFLATENMEDDTVIKNVRLERGSYLDTYLDQLLYPNGFNWYLEHESFDATENIAPVVKVFQRGEGIKKNLRLQLAGEELEMAGTDVTDLEVKTDLTRLANEMRGWGSREQKELTIPLYRAWPEIDDELTEEDLRKSDPDSAYNVSSKTSAWRLYLANEAGDIDGLRTVVQPVTEHLRLDGVFDMAIPMRRVIDDCLTKDENGIRRIPHLEWWPGDETDPGWTEPRWEVVKPEFGWVILPDQIGILFTGDTPPVPLIDAGEETKLRITCTITGDDRLNSTSSQFPNVRPSPSIRTLPLFLDLSDRFHKRSVQQDGDYASALKDEPYGADERDDADDLQEYLADRLEHELSADMGVSVKLHGIHTEYQISDLLHSVQNRAIFLNRNNFVADPPLPGRFPQVVGIRWDFQKQTTELFVDAVG